MGGRIHKLSQCVISYNTTAALEDEAGEIDNQSKFGTIKSPHITKGRLHVDKDISEFLKCTKASTELAGGR